MSRHCGKAIGSVLALGLLAGCASTGGPGPDAPDTRRAVIAADAQPAAEPASAPQAVEESSPAVDLSIEPNVDEIPEKIQRGYDSAIAAMNADDWIQAELELEQIILEEPGFPGPYVNLALIYKLDGRTGDARAALEQAIAIAPGFAPANNELGVLLREQGDFSGAQAAYERSLAADPDNAIAHLNLGILLDLYLRRPVDALDHYNQYQATRTEPDETVARWIVDLERRTQAAERTARD
ncbi:MAG: tetratricopeptide repeat protein [Gammaproteobacteria bacterium]